MAEWENDSHCTRVACHACRRPCRRPSLLARSAEHGQSGCWGGGLAPSAQAGASHCLTHRVQECGFYGYRYAHRRESHSQPHGVSRNAFQCRVLKRVYLTAAAARGAARARAPRTVLPPASRAPGVGVPERKRCAPICLMLYGFLIIYYGFTNMRVISFAYTVYPRPPPPPRVVSG